VSAAPLFALDTAGERCSLALAHAGDVEEMLGEPGSTHLEHVMPMIVALFARCGMRPEHCGAFAFASGPGSFTGLRVACTIVQGLALGSARPVIAVGHLEALAQEAAGGCAPCGAGAVRSPRRILAASDARMGQAYWAVYEAAADGWVAVAPPAVDDAAQLAQRVAQWQPDVVAARRSWFLRHAPAVPADLRDVGVSAATVARLAQVRLARGESMPPEQAVPAYVRDRVAQTVAERRQARAERPA
jgi:tRNA threonylcarbamoyladenosine biosynthesis protein TsaB